MSTAGVGWTRAVVGCWLIRHEDTGDEARAKIAQWWREMEKVDRHRRFPETMEPREYVRQRTDDTSIALCLAASLIENHGFDAADQMDRYMSSTGTCFDIGNTNRAALLHFARTGEP